VNNDVQTFLKTEILKNIDSEISLGSDVLIVYYKLSKSSFPMVLHEFNNVHKELYILYHFILAFDEVCDNNKKLSYAIPNIYNFLINYLKSAKFFISRILNKVYLEFSQTDQKLIDKFLFFHNKCDLISLKSDILNIFILGMFLNTNPIHIQNYSDYYKSSFKLIFFTYLKNKTEGVIEHEIQEDLTEDNMQMSNRFKLFEDGIKLSQIYCLCNESETLKRINSNFNEIRNRILTNEFQKLYSFIIDKNIIRDNKFLILKFNIDHDENIIRLKTELPLIYKLLRSIKVKSKNKKVFTSYDRTIIKNIIKDIVRVKIETFIGSEYAEILSESISNNLENSITTGDFLDPYTLTVLNIDNVIFLSQLKLFLNDVMSNMEMSELDHV
jgi:hypothetical protein